MVRAGSALLATPEGEAVQFLEERFQTKEIFEEGFKQERKEPSRPGELSPFCPSPPGEELVPPTEPAR